MIKQLIWFKTPAPGNNTHGVADDFVIMPTILVHILSFGDNIFTYGITTYWINLGQGPSLGINGTIFLQYPFRHK